MTAGETRLLSFMQETARFRDRVYFASDSTAARNLGVSRRTVIRWRQSLEAAGHIVRKGKKRMGVGKYTVIYSFANPPSKWKRFRREQYIEYMQSERWIELRQLALERDAGRCAACGEQATDVHHIRYPDVLGEEPLNWLVSLCKDHHRDVHRIKLGRSCTIGEATAIVIGRYVTERPTEKQLDPGLRDQPPEGTNPRVYAKGAEDEDHSQRTGRVPREKRTRLRRPEGAKPRRQPNPCGLHDPGEQVRRGTPGLRRLRRGPGRRDHCDMSERPKNPVWDALSAHFGEPRTEQERRRRGKAVKELKDANATPEEIAITIDYCKRHFTTFTEFAICGWLSRALQEHAQWQSADNVFRLVTKRADNGA